MTIGPHATRAVGAFEIVLHRAFRFLEVRERDFDARDFDRRRRRLGFGRVRSDALSVE
jgi:hypothetical protein